MADESLNENDHLMVDLFNLSDDLRQLRHEDLRFVPQDPREDPQKDAVTPEARCRF